MPKMPKEGPCRDPEGPGCRIGVHHWRARKTGPEHPLAVLRCRRHRLGFTAYPPGHVPYGRQRIAPVAPDGGVVRTEGEELAETVFSGAVDAAQGKAWSRKGGGPCWSVQGRHLGRLARWVGVSPDLGEGARSEQAAHLGVAELVLRDQADHIAARPGYRRRGEAVVRVLSALRRASRLERLLAAGFEAGLWGFPMRWDPELKRLRPIPFRPEAARCRPPPARKARR